MPIDPRTGESFEWEHPDGHRPGWDPDDDLEYDPGPPNPDAFADAQTPTVQPPPQLT